MPAWRLRGRLSRAARPGYAPCVRVALVGILVSLAAACGSESDTRCKTVCEVEARCVEESPDGDQPKFDPGECTAACRALDRDKEGKTLVDDHVQCVNDSMVAGRPDCAKVLACE
jgi:hypothetical protein